MQSIESWISEDLAKSGLTVEDIEVLPLMPKIKRDGSIIHHGGYQIIYRDAQGVLMKGCHNQLFVRERFRPPLPLDLQGGKKKYGTPAGAGIRIFFPKNVYRFAPVRQYIICGSTKNNFSICILLFDELLLHLRFQIQSGQNRAGAGRIFPLYG